MSEDQPVVPPRPKKEGEQESQPSVPQRPNRSPAIPPRPIRANSGNGDAAEPVGGETPEIPKRRPHRPAPDVAQAPSIPSQRPVKKRENNEEEIGSQPEHSTGSTGGITGSESKASSAGESFDSPIEGDMESPVKEPSIEEAKNSQVEEAKDSQVEESPIEEANESTIGRATEEAEGSQVEESPIEETKESSPSKESTNEEVEGSQIEEPPAEEAKESQAKRSPVENADDFHAEELPESSTEDTKKALSNDDEPQPEVPKRPAVKEEPPVDKPTDDSSSSSLEIDTKNNTANPEPSQSNGSGTTVEPPQPEPEIPAVPKRPERKVQVPTEETQDSAMHDGESDHSVKESVAGQQESSAAAPNLQKESPTTESPTSQPLVPPRPAKKQISQASDSERAPEPVDSASAKPAKSRPAPPPKPKNLPAGSRVGALQASLFSDLSNVISSGFKAPPPPPKNIEQGEAKVYSSTGTAEEESTDTNTTSSDTTTGATGATSATSTRPRARGPKRRLPAAAKTEWTTVIRDVWELRLEPHQPSPLEETSDAGERESESPSLIPEAERSSKHAELTDQHGEQSDHHGELHNNHELPSNQSDGDDSKDEDPKDSQDEDRKESDPKDSQSDISDESSSGPDRHTGTGAVLADPSRSLPDPATTPESPTRKNGELHSDDDTQQGDSPPGERQKGQALKQGEEAFDFEIETGNTGDE